MRAQLNQLPQGELQGLPITIKSSISTAGHHCEIGSVLRRSTVATEDAAAVGALRQAGALILGTTNCPEFLMAYETDNLIHGGTRNPWALDRTAGGSSGGEAAAIASGISAGGLGSDSGGSVREPAHFTGICSLKPTSGRISAKGHQPPCVGPFSTLGAIGPMARTIADVELLFTVGSENSANGVSGYDAMSESIAKSYTIGWFDEDEMAPVTVATRSSVRNSVEALKARGFSVEARHVQFLREAQRLWKIFFVQCGAMFYEASISGRRSELSPIFRNFLDMSAEQHPLTAASLLTAWAESDLLRARMLREMEEIRIFLLPVSSIPAFQFGEREWIVDGRKVSYLDAMGYMQWVNLLGAPAAVVPVGQSEEGLPIGVQIVGRPHEDELVLAVAKALDAEFGYRVPRLLEAYNTL